MFDFQSRLERVRTHLSEKNLDGFLFSDLSNIFYLTGFTGSDGLLLCTAKDPHLFVDGRYGSQAESQSDHAEIHVYKSQTEDVGEFLRTNEIHRLEFEQEHLIVSKYESLQKKASSTSWIHSDKWLKRFRSIKDEKEIELLKRAHGIANRSIEEVLKKVSVGMKEGDLALELEFEMKRQGADALSFPILVGSGERGALPHATPTDKALKEAEFVFVDFGCKVNGYCTDHTVSFCLGEPEKKWAGIFDLVKEAHDRAIVAAKPGVKVSELDAVSRNFLKENGFEKEFSHSLGHGIGIDVHEWPGISYREDAALREGMVFTIEPGIYIPGEGGIRIEDVGVLRSDGYEILTNVDKELRRL